MGSRRSGMTPFVLVVFSIFEMNFHLLCCCCVWPIMLTCSCNVYPPYTPRLYSKSGVYRDVHDFLIFALKDRLWVLVRTASLRRF